MYCDECVEDNIHYTGKNNPNYRDAKKDTQCDNCGSEFEYYPSDKDGRFCSECVKEAEYPEGPADRSERGKALRVDYDDPPEPSESGEASSGRVSEKVFEAEMARLDVTISEPFREECEYDYIADVNDDLYRVQVKTGKVRRGALVFSVAPSTRRRDGRDEYTKVDVFVVRNRSTDDLYWIPDEHIDVRTQKNLRLEDSKINNHDSTPAHVYKLRRRLKEIR